jgi:DNA (cytosine-5)-methyltransferase 1
MSTGYFSVKETSEMLGYSEQYVRKLLRSDELSGELISNRWVVASESANIYQQLPLHKIYY